jgi:hypothetical protein
MACALSLLRMPRLSLFSATRKAKRKQLAENYGSRPSAAVAKLDFSYTETLNINDPSPWRVWKPGLCYHTRLYRMSLPKIRLKPDCPVPTYSLCVIVHILTAFTLIAANRNR